MVDGRLSLPGILGADAGGAEGAEYDEDAGDETELIMLQKVVQQTLEKKKAAAAKQQTQVLEEFKAGAEARIAALENQIAKDAKDTAALAKGAFSKASQRLADKVAQMEALTVKYQQDMAALWGQYNEEHSALDNVAMQVKMAAEQKKQGVKRRIAALVQENDAALTEARKKAESVKGKAAKMPQLAKLLQSFM